MLHFKEQFFLSEDVPALAQVQYLFLVDLLDGHWPLSGSLSGQDDFTVGTLAHVLAQNVVLDRRAARGCARSARIRAC